MMGNVANWALREKTVQGTHKVISEHLDLHCRDCGFEAEFTTCSVIGRSSQKPAKEIIQVEKIARLKYTCVSAPILEAIKQRVNIFGTWER